MYHNGNQNSSSASLHSKILRVGGLSLDNRHDFSQALNQGLPVRRSYTSQSLYANGYNHRANGNVSNGNGDSGNGVLPYRLIQQFNQPLQRRQRSCRTSVCTELSRSSSPASFSGTFSPRSGSSGSSRTLMSPNSYESTMPAPRRVFPQRASLPRLAGIEDTDGSPVVFDAELSFGIASPPNGRSRSRVAQRVQPTAAHLEPSTTSAYISRKIADFLQRTDHVMEEWKRLGRKDPDEDMRDMMGNGGSSLARSRSAANIMTRAMRYFSRGSSVATSAGGHTLPPEDFTLSEADELSGLTVDLADEHSTATLASERLEVEVADRLRLEKELVDVQEQNKRLQQSAERLELELLHSRTADLNGLNSEEEDSAEDGGDANAALRARYERTVRELDFTKRRLQQQHEDDLEQLVALKKQLEKKLADAYEEVEEQRQVVGQWKRKVQKLSAETSDLRLLVETQSSRNNFLEKKQRKFDSELQLLQDELRQEKQHRERISREKELVLGEKYSLEQTLSSVRLELESREERVAALTRELEELTFGGKAEEDVAAAKKARHLLEQRVKEQEEELDDMAGQVQLLEQAKLRLEMSLEQMRKENRREIAQRDDELEDARSQAYKKVKALESQLESEHEERTLLVREKHELERRLNAVEEDARVRAHQEDGHVQRLRRDLKRTRALLNDAHSQLERLKADTPNKAALRTLRNQLEDLEFARAQAVKARQTAESELSDVQSALEEAQRAKQDMEERCNVLNRECSELRTQLEENEEELAEVLKKYRAAVHQMSTDQIALQDSVARVGELEAERNALSEQLADLTARLASIETMGDPSSSVAAKRLELRTKELESRLELEQTTRGRMEVQISRLKENVDKLQTEVTQSRTRETLAQDAARKAQRSLRELREECASLTTRENEATERRKSLEKRLEVAEAESATAKTDLKVALQRIEDLQQAIQGDLELESSCSENSDIDNDSDDSDESIETFLAHHNMASNSNRLSGSFTSKRSSLSDRSPRSENADSSLSGQFSNTPKEQAS